MVYQYTHVRSYLDRERHRQRRLWEQQRRSGFQSSPNRFSGQICARCLWGTFQIAFRFLWRSRRNITHHMGPDEAFCFRILLTRLTDVNECKRSRISILAFSRTNPVPFPRAPRLAGEHHNHGLIVRVSEDALGVADNIERNFHCTDYAGCSPRGMV